MYNKGYRGKVFDLDLDWGLSFGLSCKVCRKRQRENDHILLYIPHTYYVEKEIERVNCRG